MFNRIRLGKIGLALCFCALFIGLAALAAISWGAAAVGAGLLMIGLGTVYEESNYLGDILFSEQDLRASREVVTLASGENRAKGTIIGKITKALGAVVPDEGNTGDGTVGTITMGALAKLGNYVLECIGQAVGAITTPVTGTADEGNTGDGTVTGVTAGAKAKAGTYALNCKKASDVKGATASSAAFAGNTGDGAMGEVTVGANAKAGAYKLVIIEPAANAGKFQVEDPDGIIIGTGTVGVEYSIGTHITFTLADGSTDFVAGDGFTITVAAAGTGGEFEVRDPDGNLLPPAKIGTAYTSAQINFTINDGAADFVVGDKFTVLASAADGNAGTFQVKDPAGNLLPNATAAVAYANAQINFTINDGDADFVVGDKFTIPVNAGSGKAKILAPAAVDGTHEAYGMLIADVDASAADVDGVAIVRDAILKSAGLVWPTGITAGQKAAALVELKAKHITAREGA